MGLWGGCAEQWALHASELGPQAAGTSRGAGCAMPAAFGAITRQPKYRGAIGSSSGRLASPPPTHSLHTLQPPNDKCNFTLHHVPALQW